MACSQMFMVMDLSDAYLCCIVLLHMILQMPVENSIEKNLCCWLCMSGPITISARTDRQGYCPGELILNVCYSILELFELNNYNSFSCNMI